MPLRRRTKRGRWGDLWWEVLVALLIVCGGVLAGWRAARPGGGWILPAISSRWAIIIPLVVVMAVVIAQVYRPLRRSFVFWGMSAAFLCVLGASAYAWFPNGTAGAAPRAIWFGAIGGAEFAPYAYLVYRKFHVLPKQSR